MRGTWYLHKILKKKVPCTTHGDMGPHLGQASGTCPARGPLLTCRCPNDAYSYKGVKCADLQYHHLLGALSAGMWGQPGCRSGRPLTPCSPWLEDCVIPEALKCTRYTQVQLQTG